LTFRGHVTLSVR